MPPRRRATRDVPSSSAMPPPPVSSESTDVSHEIEDTSSMVDPGPIDASLLTMQASHRSQPIWLGEVDDQVMEVCRHNMWPLDARIEPYVVRAGFYPWTLVQNMKVDHALLTALVERWRTETHTFHLRPGEMTITLCDVGVITGLPVDGSAVTGSEDVPNWDQLCIELLGEVPEKGKTRTSVKRTWFRDHFMAIPEDADDIVIQRYARVYLLCMIGTSLMPDGSGSDISLHYLPLLRDLDAIARYSWGSAVLAYLYRQLCLGCLKKHRQLSGCTVLLQIWAWEHMHLGRPTQLGIPPPLAADEDRLRAPALGYTKWSGPKTYRDTTPQHVLVVYRDQLDRQEDVDLIWVPYTDEVVDPLNPMCTQGRHIWAAEVPLLCFNIAEWHYPSRVMRQYNCRQPIPPPPRATHRDLHSKTRKKPKVNWAMELAVYITLWDDRADHLVGGEELDDTSDGVTPEYLAWYDSITRRFIQPRKSWDETLSYRPASQDLNFGIQGFIRSGRAAAQIFAMDIPSPARRIAHDLFHASYNDLRSVNREAALGVDPSLVQFHDGPTNVCSMPGNDTQGPSQVTQLEEVHDAGLRRSARPKKTVRRVEKFFGGKAYIGLRIPDADSGSRQDIDGVLVTKGEAVVISVKNFSGFASIDRDGSWVCEGTSRHKTERHPDPVVEVKDKIAILESYLEQRGVALPEGYLSYKVIIPNPKFRIIHSNYFPPEVITYDDWTQLKPESKGYFSGWIKGALSGGKKDMQESVGQKLEYVLGTAPSWDRLELKGNKYLLGEFLEFKGKQEDVLTLRAIKRSKINRIVVQKTSMLGFAPSRLQVLYSFRDYRSDGASVSEWKELHVRSSTEILFQPQNSSKVSKFKLSSTVSLTLSA